MTHIGQEARLGPIRVFRLIQCVLEYLALFFLRAHGFLNIMDPQKDPAGFRPYADRNDLNLIGRADPVLIREPEIMVQRVVLRQVLHNAFQVQPRVKGFIFLFVQMAEPVKKSGEGAIGIKLRDMIQITVIRAEHRKGVPVYIRADQNLIIIRQGAEHHPLLFLTLLSQLVDHKGRYCLQNQQRVRIGAGIVHPEKADNIAAEMQRRGHQRLDALHRQNLVLIRIVVQLAGGGIDVELAVSLKLDNPAIHNGEVQVLQLCYFRFNTLRAPLIGVAQSLGAQVKFKYIGPVRTVERRDQA